MSGGRFLSLEGGEGAGKSTQAAALADALRAHGIAVHTTREPGGSEGAEAIRGLLLQGEATRWGAQAEALLFAAARADHVEKVIRPAIAAGTWVICDRFLDSSRAYQGGAGGIDDAALLALHAFGSGGYLPDRTFLLALPAQEGARRAERRDGAAMDRFAARDEAFHAEVAAAFDRFAQAEPGRIIRVDATRSAAEVTAEILQSLESWLP